jgi:hypothetical protein
MPSLFDLREMGDGGSVAALFGRCGLGNPLVADFRADPQGHWCCSTDPGAYLLSKPDWAPTCRRPTRWRNGHRADTANAWLRRQDQRWFWSFADYTLAAGLPAGDIRLITPPAIVATLQAGYRPV